MHNLHRNEVITIIVTEYIASFLADKGIHDVFGYPGGMVTYLMDALARCPRLTSHLCYHEQGAAFAAVGYGRIKNIPGVAYATSGPGATNLLTGIADAYFDSVPTIFITGQVNTYDLKRGNMRQHGFQETDIVAMAKPIVKAAMQVTEPDKVPAALDYLYNLAMSGRKGPVLLDLPMDVQRSDCPAAPTATAQGTDPGDLAEKILPQVVGALQQSTRPLILAGAGIRQADAADEFRAWVERLQIPVVTSMTAVDLMSRQNPLCLGFIGAYGHRWANFATAKADLILALGSRLDARQTGADPARFAPGARILRVDIDPAELAHKIHAHEEQLRADLKTALTALRRGTAPAGAEKWRAWHEICAVMRRKLQPLDVLSANELVRDISRQIPAAAVVTADVGQNQVWVAQSFDVKAQRILFSGGHGAMGFSLPAAIGACIANGRQPVYAFCGDGGLHMNIQELQTVVREKLPIKILLLNNRSLGMIRHFQEMYFDARYVQTKAETGYTVPDFVRIAQAYGLPAQRITGAADFDPSLTNDEPMLYDIACGADTYVFPKLAVQKPIYDQEPLMPRQLLAELEKL